MPPLPGRPHAGARPAAGGRSPALARAGKAAEGRCRSRVGPGFQAEPPAPPGGRPPRRLRIVAGAAPSTPGFRSAGGALFDRRSGPAERPARQPGDPRDDATRHETRSETRAARPPSICRRQPGRRPFGIPGPPGCSGSARFSNRAEPADAAFLAGELGQRGWRLARAAARTILRGHPRRTTRRIGARERAVQKVPVVRPDCRAHAGSPSPGRTGRRRRRRPAGAASAAR